MNRVKRPLVGAIVGFGAIAERAHVDALATVGLEIAAVLEVLPERSEAARRILPRARHHSDLTTLLETKATRGLDFVDVCTPPHLHVPVAEAAARTGLHVLVEKPLATNLADAIRLAGVARRHGVVITCVNNWTHAPILLRVQQLIAGGVIGSLHDVEIVVERTEPAMSAGFDNWRVDRDRAGGGILFDHGWHGMSILGRVIPEVALSVRGMIERRRFPELAVEDTATMEIDFAGGIRARFSATWAAERRHNRIRANGTAGTIEVDNDVLTVVDARGMRAERFAESLADGGYRPGWTAAIVREFVDEIVSPDRPVRAVDEALTCMGLLAAAYASDAHGGQTVDIAARA